MNRIATLCVLACALLLVTAPAEAAPKTSFTLMDALNRVNGSITVPPEWDGIWTTQDSVYDCMGAFQETSTDPDTLCAGQEITEDPEGAPFTVDCTGTANATVVDVTCTGSGEVFPDCDLTITVKIDAVRNGEMYDAVSTTMFEYTGTGFGCDLLQDSCTQVNSHGTRTGPAPAAYCATPVHRSTWGEVKTRYR